MHNIIKTPNYLLIVDDSKIELGSWHTCIYPEYPLEARFTDESTKYDICKGCKNIIAHLPLNNAPTLEGVDLLPPIEPIGFDEYQYTEEDLRKAMKYASEITNNKMKYMEDYIQSLQQPKYPIGFECEKSLCFPSHCFRDCDMRCKYPRPKTTTNSQGLTQWVGEYIY
jgi:hypothetical protein